MRRKLTGWCVVVAFSAVLLSSCATSERTYQGAAAGGALGAVAGVLIDKDNRWRGAVIGGALGAALGGTVTEISTRAAREAAQTGKPVAYQSTDGWQKVEATPVARSPQTSCTKVQQKTWQDGKLIKEEIKEVCP